MKILGIETSCDDTCIALVEARGKKRVSFNVLSNIVSSQVEIHRKWEGVYPALAKREHQKNLILVLKKALKEAGMFQNSKLKVQNSKLGLKSKNLKKILEREPELLKDFLKVVSKIKKPKIDAIAVTAGPGLEPCLWTGVNFAKALSYFWTPPTQDLIPIIPVNHIEAHIYANYLNSGPEQFVFPAICLIISGGHTQLILMKDYGTYKILGETRDDAAGECLDKVARILGLGYPGGPAIAAKASEFQILNSKFQIKLPRPMFHSQDYDFSFSGLKTAVLYKVKGQSSELKNQNYVQAMSFEVQQAIIDVLISKTIRAAKECKVKTIMLGGGVAANQELRKQFKKKVKNEFPNSKFYIPGSKFCTDNAAMVALTAYFHYLKGEKENWQEIKAKANLRLGE